MEQAELALADDETPVGCVFVHKGEIIGRGMNETNRSRNVCYSWLSGSWNYDDIVEHIVRVTDLSRVSDTQNLLRLKSYFKSMIRRSLARQTSTLLLNLVSCAHLRCVSTEYDVYIMAAVMIGLVGLAVCYPYTLSKRLQRSNYF